MPELENCETDGCCPAIVLANFVMKIRVANNKLVKDKIHQNEGFQLQFLNLWGSRPMLLVPTRGSSRFGAYKTIGPVVSSTSY